MIPLIKPGLPNLEQVIAELQEGKLTNFGPCYWRLVDAMAEITGRYDVPVTSGATAIQLAAQVTFKRGSRILIPDYTHIGTLQAIVAAGMRPVLAPVSKQTWTLNVGVLASSGEEFDGFVVVSPFGFHVEQSIYDQLSKDLGKPVIYDFAGGFGMKITTKAPVCYSMHATKNLPVGEGGIVSFSSLNDASEAHQLSCFDQNKDRSIRSPYGGNHKLDEIRCAIALSRLKEVWARIERKKALITIYQDLFQDLCIPHELHVNGAPSLCVLSGLDANKLSQCKGFESKQYYPLLSDMPGLDSVTRIGKSSLFFRTCVALPSDVTDDEAISIAKEFVSFADAKARRK